MSRPSFQSTLTAPHPPLLEVTGLEAGYGQVKVLKGIEFSVGKGELVTLLGRNGMGKSTFIKTVMGIVSVQNGSVRFDGVNITRHASHKIAQCGVGYVPEGRHIFPNLSVLENLIATHRRKQSDARWTLETVFDLFPRLKERAGNGGDRLSGGEQQMLAIGRALMTNPRLLILDEATEGLAPLIRREIWSCLETLKQTGLSMIVIDKNINALKSIANRHVILSKGTVVWSGTSKDLDESQSTVTEFLGV